MLDIPVSCQFYYDDSREENLHSIDNHLIVCGHLPTVFRVAKTAIDAEWTFCCVWPRINPHLSLPIFIEIRRKSSAGELLISGNLSFSDRSDHDPLLRKRFVRLIEHGQSTIRLRLQFYLREPTRPAPNSYALSGHFYVFDSSKKYLIDLADIGTSKEIPRESSSDKADQILSFPDVNAKKGSVRSLMKVSNDFLRLLDEQEQLFCDVKLKCGQVSISAHKNVLSARSPVFSAMFKSYMKESQENVVDVPDIEESVLQTMLTFVYSGRTCKLNESLAADLLFAADKYQLDELKAVCCSYLKRHICVSNAVNVLVLGELHDRDLKTSVLKFMSTKCEEFSNLEKTEEWSKLLKDRPGLAIEVLTSLVKHQEGKCKKLKT